MNIPPFPDDVATEELIVIDYGLLVIGDSREIGKLWDAATMQGFWYLRLDDLGPSADVMYALSHQALGLPLAEKVRLCSDDENGSFGYKAMGASAVDQKGTTDITEFMNISQDDVLAYPDVMHRSYPPLISNAMVHIIRPFVERCVSINKVLLNRLSDRLCLPEGTLCGKHSSGNRSCSELRFLRTKPCSDGSQIALGAHTDFGSLSLLFNQLGGLQILSPADGTWKYVKPIPGHAICNVGDALHIFSGGLLKSCVHRVMPPPGLQAQSERWSIAFFTRPCDHVILHPLVKMSGLVAVAAEEFPDIMSVHSTAAHWYTRKSTKFAVYDETH
ncbi:Clavaminate synthase-like protein [Neolentinus lepideus HHB14362 ss-1]|uniref:Clavaminate synthase-like protein n=1 Tax=Neolentinus lepideus HHB14362 ss-1 TaxID=1314782 RepID=A0A165ULP5_9AGAM|nr:Clavaminate synthase-like protein [Neolentinus lepideus HHB14362 ss-1]